MERQPQTKDSTVALELTETQPQPIQPWQQNRDVHQSLARCTPFALITGEPLFFCLGEQLMILVLGTYGYRLTDWIAGIQSRESLDVQNVVTTYSRREAGKLLIDVANGVFRDLKWTPLCHKPSFGVSRTLNYDSPLREGSTTNEKLLWTAVVQPGKKIAYRRSPLTPSVATNMPTLAVIKGQTYHDANSTDRKKRESRVTFLIGYRQGEPYPTDPNTEVTVVFEIMSNNAQHEWPYARLPNIGRYSDWQVANRLAVRLEWQEKGQWKSRYVQRDGRGFMGTKDPGCIRTYAEAMGLIRYFEQLTQESPRGWDLTYGLARVKRIDFDHMTQTVHISEVAPQGRSMPAPYEKTPNEVAREVAALGAYNANGAWRDWHPDVRGPKAKNRKCDACCIEEHYVVSGCPNAYREEVTNVNAGNSKNSRTEVKSMGMCTEQT